MGDILFFKNLLCENWKFLFEFFIILVNNWCVWYLYLLIIFFFEKLVMGLFYCIYGCNGKMDRNCNWKNYYKRE